MLVMEYLPLGPSVCSAAQGEEINRIVGRVKELKTQPGYIIDYFEVEKCTEWIRYDTLCSCLKVKFLDEEEIQEYSTPVIWYVEFEGPGEYKLRIEEDGIRVG